MSVPSTRMSLPHDRVWVSWRPAPLGGVPDGADGDAGDGAEHQRTASQRQRQREQFDDDRRAEVERERRHDLAEPGPDDQRDAAADDQEERGRRQRAAAADEQPGGDQGQARGAAIMSGSRTSRNCGTSKSYSPWKTDSPSSSPPMADACRTKRVTAADLAVAVVGGQPAVALLLEDQQADDRQPGAGDEHQVGGAPERDVLAEEPVPDVVEREAEQGVEAGAGGAGCRRPARPSP